VDAVWLGMKIAFGIVLGFVVIYFVWRELSTLRFVRAGCTYQDGKIPGSIAGWTTRDIRNDDWIIWDVNRRIVQRCSDEDDPSKPWRPSNETLSQFLDLARQYQDYWSKSENDNRNKNPN
jgi:hypothetical protein